MRVFAQSYLLLCSALFTKPFLRFAVQTLKVKYALFIALLLSTSGAMAHTELASSIPTDQQSLTVAPAELQLVFKGKVSLAKVSLTHKEQGDMPLDFTPIMRPSKVFRIPLPTLENGAYQAQWIAVGGDGHKIKGLIHFMLDMNN